MLSKLPVRLLQKFAKAPKSEMTLFRRSEPTFKRNFKRTFPATLLGAGTLKSMYPKDSFFQKIPEGFLALLPFTEEHLLYKLHSMSSNPVTLNEKIAAKIKEKALVPLHRFLIDLDTDDVMQWFVGNTLISFPVFLFFLPENPGLLSMLLYFLSCLVVTVGMLFSSILHLFFRAIDLKSYLV